MHTTETGMSVTHYSTYTLSYGKYFISWPVTKGSKAHRNTPHGNTRILMGTHCGQTKKPSHGKKVHVIQQRRGCFENNFTAI